ncbi:2TM domain-containing protein [Spirosoma agri]|uniref:2TM domain-containing protein n=2 Tax=Spirosoma agri TaxID=1987381 RepID=A0A6M0IMA7_9BACT|nr:2TM domain-containing protein [Spirosoma agri]
METPSVSSADRNPLLWKQAKARVGFKLHLRSYLVVNAGLWLLWAAMALLIHTPGRDGLFFPWPVFSSLGWGFGLAAHYFRVYSNGGSAETMIEQEYQKLASQQ